MRLTLLASAAILFALPAFAQSQRPPKGAPEIEPNTYAAYWRQKTNEAESEAAQANGEAAALNKHLVDATAKIAELEKQIADLKKPADAPKPAAEAKPTAPTRVGDAALVTPPPPPAVAAAEAPKTP